MFQSFSVGLDLDEATLQRTACLPTPDCESSAPTEMVFVRR
jgi:hypothetical protein